MNLSALSKPRDRRYCMSERGILLPQERAMTSIARKVGDFLVGLWSDPSAPIEGAMVAREGADTVIRICERPAAAKPTPKPASKPNAKPAKRGRPAKAAAAPATSPAARFDALAYVAAHPGSTRDEIVAAARTSGLRSTGPVISALNRMVKSGTITLQDGRYAASAPERQAA